MGFTKERLDQIYTRTNGKCHLCHGRIARSNYGVVGVRGGWEVDHSRARVLGGTDHGNNLLPAHIACNRSKQARSARSVRAKNGKTRAPLSAAARERAVNKNTAVGAGIGALAGLLFGGPAGALALGLTGAAIGDSQDPE